MKIGVRKPNVKKRIKSRTTGRAKRTIKRSVNPLYGKKGVGLIRDPKRSVYNKVYNKTSVGVLQAKKVKNKSSQKNNRNEQVITKDIDRYSNISSKTTGLGCFSISLLILSFLAPPLFVITIPLTIYSIKRLNEEEKQSKKDYENYLLKLDVISELEGLEELIENLNNENNLDRYFNKLELVDIKFSEILETLNKSDSIVSQKDIETTKRDHKIMIRKSLKSFIKRYEEKAFDKATKLKTERGQRNNYQRSFNDLNEYKKHFDSDVSKYIEERWQNI